MGRGFTNFKRLLGHPDDFALVVDELAATVPPGHAVAGCDEGSWALAGDRLPSGTRVHLVDDLVSL